ncbi:MAG: MFS transporter [Solitalea-like symbiont of Acarus siro]
MSRHTTACNGTEKINLRIVTAGSIAHLVNDMFQMVVIAIYPILKQNLSLSFTQISLLTLIFQFVASLLQPFLGYLSDKKPQPYMLTLGMFSHLAGIIILAFAHTFPLLIISVVLIGIGSATFHPEATKISQLASGKRPGLAQSIFQLGGNTGSALGPLLAAILIVPFGQSSFIVLALIAVITLFVISKMTKWYKIKIEESKRSKIIVSYTHHLSKTTVFITITILLFLTFSKFVYINSFSNYYIFYLQEKFKLTLHFAEICLFIFLFSIALGTMIGGPLGDKFGRRYIIWLSILGVAPFSLLLPYAGLALTIFLSTIAGILLASAFPAILVYAQEMMPKNVGTVSGLFFGFACGIAGLSALLLGYIADHYGIITVYNLCSVLPLLGFLALFLPNITVEKIVS